MVECDECGRDENMPYECKRCGGSYCVEHRLPEGHDCPALNAWDGSGGGALGGSGPGTTSRRQSPGPVGGQSSGGLARKLPIDTGPGGLTGYFRNNMTYVFLLAIWVTFVLQWVVLLTAGRGLHDTLFVSRSTHVEYAWTWVTSVFAHNPYGLWHIGLNSLVLYFFGPLVERKLGSKRFALFFVGAGVVASLGAALVPLAMGQVSGGLGASGAILGIMGVLTILNPDLRVMLLFPPIPMPLWVMTAGIAAISVFFIGFAGPGAGGIGHLAHLFGLLTGLVYGKKLQRDGMTAPSQLQMGGGPGGPGGGLGGRRRF